MDFHRPNHHLPASNLCRILYFSEKNIEKMSLHRFFVKQVIDKKKIFINDKNLLHQLKNVLRLKIDEKIILIDVNNKAYLTIIKNYNNNEVGLEILQPEETNKESQLKITLYQSLIKKNNFELVLQKGTELGVSNFVPVLAARSEKKGLKKERCQKIIQEAAEQSGRIIIPSLQKITSFSQALASAPQPLIFLHMTGQPIKTILNKNYSSMSVFVGPEGDWTPQELEQAKKAGAIFINLGKTILRSETAAIVSLGIVLCGQ